MRVRKGVQNIFREVASTYELVNHVLTFGMDRVWRRTAARTASQGGGHLWLDVCSGTGEMARDLRRFGGREVTICVADFSDQMLEAARRKLRGLNLIFILTDARMLPFPDQSFDLITISFATRNLSPNRNVLAAHLREFHRVLRPGGRLVNLETSQPRNPIVRCVFHTYVRLMVRPIGRWISGSDVGYRYLSFTIPRHYDAESFAHILREEGFSSVSYQRLFCGVAAIHTASKSDRDLSQRGDRNSPGYRVT